MVDTLQLKVASAPLKKMKAKRIHRFDARAAPSWGMNGTRFAVLNELTGEML